MKESSALFQGGFGHLLKRLVDTQLSRVELDSRATVTVYTRIHNWTGIPTQIVFPSSAEGILLLGNKDSKKIVAIFLNDIYSVEVSNSIEMFNLLERPWLIPGQNGPISKMQLSRELQSLWATSELKINNKLETFPSEDYTVFLLAWNKKFLEIIKNLKLDYPEAFSKVSDVEITYTDKVLEISLSGSTLNIKINMDKDSFDSNAISEKLNSSL